MRLFFTSTLLCRSKTETEELQDFFSTIGPVKPFIHYKVMVYSHIFGDLTFQVSKKQYEEITVGKTYHLSIGDPEKAQ